MEKKIDIGKKAKVSIVWKVKPVDYSKEKENNIRTLFAKKYDIPESNIIIEKDYQTSVTNTNAGLNSENIKSITDPAFQHKLFKEYIEENNIEDCNFDEIVKIDSTVNALMDYSQYETGKRYSVKWLDWSNFLSYGKENHFDFTQLHGLVLLNGEPANKSGKSTFAYDLLHFLFFGETKSGKAKTESGQFNLGALFNSFLPDETELKVEGCINIEGSDYIIRRTLKRPSKSKKEIRTATQKIEYFKVCENGEMEELKDSVNLQEESSTKTNKIIKEAIGNEKDFDLIISANAKDLDDLISLKNDERGKLLSRWIGLSCLEDKNNKAKEIWNKKISVGRYCDLYNRETLKNEIKELEETNVQTSKDNEIIDGKIKECEKKIKQYTSDKERYFSEKKPVDENLLKKGDITTLEKRLEIIKTDGVAKTKQANDLKEESAKIKEVDYSLDEYNELKSMKDNLVEEIASIKANIKLLKEKNKSLAEGEYCPTCHRKYDNIDNTKLIEANESGINKLIQEGITKNSKKEELIKEIERIEVIRNNQTEKNKIELKVAALESQILSLRLEGRDIIDTIKKLKENKEAIKYNDELDAKINVCNDSINIEDKIRINLNNTLSENKAMINHNIESIKEKKSYIVKIENELAIEKNWKLYLKMIGKDGISKMVLRNAIPIINAEINRLLTGVADFEVQVEINEKGDVNFIMSRDGIKYNLAGASGLEKTQAALALRVVLGNMSNLCNVSFILLDEVLGGVAEANYDDMKKLYDKIVANYDFVLHICHLNQWIEYHDQIITVQKINNISSIKSVTNYV